ncbi:MAG TPA: serine/threonine-protein kinase [Candidatus Binatia bacterium]
MSELSPGQTLDQYELLDVIARSGMATVFRARDLDNGHTVALKVPYLEYEADLVFHERFKREEQIGQRLDHPAIIKVLRPKEKSRVYLVMEYVEGELLSERLRRERRFPVKTAVTVARQIADALVYLHEHNVVHRDLKPANIMLQPYGRVKLIDFGIALDTTLRKMTWGRMSQAMGTPDYMAPEQIKGLRGDARTDIYSLGAILYEMLTGEVPFTGNNVHAAMRAKMQEDPTPPRRLRNEISLQLEEVVLHALERQPHDRFDSALELREALTHLDSVQVTGRAARQRPKPKLPPWMRTLLTVVLGIVAYGLLMWTFSQISSRFPQGHPDHGRSTDSIERRR